MNIKNRNWFQGLNVQKKLTRAAELIELLLGVIILLHCIVSTAGMVFSVNVVKLFYNTAYLQYQLSSACLIIIGVELIMMITSYSLDSVVAVMWMPTPAALMMGALSRFSAWSSGLRMPASRNMTAGYSGSSW